MSLGVRPLERDRYRCHFDRRSGAVQIDDVVDVELAHPRAAVDLRDDQTLLDEVAESLADRAAPSAERSRQGSLGKRLSGSHSPGEDCGPQLLQDLLGS